MSQKTIVSVIIPFLNEEKYIKECLNSVLVQDYGKENVEILLMDGGCDDATARNIKEFILGNTSDIKLLTNPGRTTSSGFNIGIKNCRGGYVIILGAHAFLDSAYISICVKEIEKTGAVCVGGKVTILADSFIKKAVAFARSSLVGGSILAHRYSHQGCFVRNVSYGVYRRDVFEKVGLFDEKLIHNQDEELNWRILKLGLKIYFTPEAKSYYRHKRNFQQFINQLFRYGFWKAQTMKKHPDFFRISFIVPAFFIVSLVCSFFIGLFFRNFLYVFVMQVLIYCSTILSFSFFLSLREGLRYIFILPFVYCAIHFSIGSGLLIGAFKGKR